MTTVIARETEHGVEWGFDSQVSIGHEQRGLEMPKVFTNGDYVIGGSGHLVDLQTIKAMNLPELDTWDVDNWMTKVFLKKLRKSKAFGEDGFQSHLLVEIGGRVYDVTSDFAWTRYLDGVYVIGSGGAYAYGAIQAGATLLEALEIAGNTDAYTGAPYTVTTSVQLRGEVNE